MSEIYTRTQYMSDCNAEGMKAHRRFFGQFVTPGTILRVVSCIGRDKLLTSTDPHFKDIPLELWDRLTPSLPGSGGFAKAGDYYTLGNGVCLAKEAARQYVEAEKVKVCLCTQRRNKSAPHFGLRSLTSQSKRGKLGF